MPDHPLLYSEQSCDRAPCDLFDEGYVMNRRYRDPRWMQDSWHAGTSAKDALRGLAGLALIAAGMFWFPIQWQLVQPVTWGETCIALSGGLFIVIGPPVLVSFLIPWSPAGMLLAGLKWRTVGQGVVLGASLFLLYYSITVLIAWWGARPVVAESGMVTLQAILGIIAYILVPALLWAPVSSAEMAEELKQAQAVERYKIQTAADMAILQNKLLWAQQKAAVGFANLVAGEREELIGIMQGLVLGIDQTTREIAGNLEQATGIAMEFPSLTEDDSIARLLATAADGLRGRIVTVEQASTPSSPSSALVPIAPPSRQPVSAVPILSTDHLQAYETARRLLGDRAFKRSDIERVLTVEKTKALQLIAAWRSAGLVTAIANPKDHYVFAGGE